jgi:hypothetical protein
MRLFWFFLRWYSSVPIDSRTRRWCMPGDAKAVDLSSMLYRLHRAIGGGWTEMIKVDTSMAAALGQWRAVPCYVADRVCPLCGLGPGTPRHVIMECHAVRPLVDALRDDVEAALIAVKPNSLHVQRAAAWRCSEEEQENGQRFGSLPPGAAARWPTLCAWGWLVPMPEREALFNEDEGGHSAKGTAAERAADLAYRAVLPRPLVSLLCRREAAVEQASGDAPANAQGRGHVCDSKARSQRPCCGGWYKCSPWV